MDRRNGFQKTFNVSFIKGIFEKFTSLNYTEVPRSRQSNAVVNNGGGSYVPCH